MTPIQAQAISAETADIDLVMTTMQLPAPVAVRVPTRANNAEGYKRITISIANGTPNGHTETHTISEREYGWLESILNKMAQPQPNGNPGLLDQLKTYTYQTFSRERAPEHKDELLTALQQDWNFGGFGFLNGNGNDLSDEARVAIVAILESQNPTPLTVGVQVSPDAAMAPNFRVPLMVRSADNIQWQSKNQVLPSFILSIIFCYFGIWIYFRFVNRKVPGPKFLQNNS